MHLGNRNAHIISFGVVAVTALLGSSYTRNSVKSSWYNCIRPSLTPPNYLFPIVWTILYILLALAIARCIQKPKTTLHYDTILYLFALNLMFNVAWCYFYFGQRNVTAGLFSIILLWTSIVCLIYFLYQSRDMKSVNYLIPYGLWVSFAGLLNVLSLKNASRC